MTAVLFANAPGWPTEEEDWPDPVYFPQSLPKPPTVTGTGSAQTRNVSGSTGANLKNLDGKSQRKGIWPFKRGIKTKVDKNQKLPTEEQIVRVGPKDPPAYPDPLLRLSFPIQTEQGTVQPGYYLVRQLSRDDQGRTLALTRQHQVVLKFNVFVVPDEPKSPIQPVDRTAPPRVSMEAVLSADRKTMTLLLKEGIKRYESPAFPTMTDPRKILTH